jgi:hypothetical protein
MLTCQAWTNCRLPQLQQLSEGDFPCRAAQAVVCSKTRNNRAYFPWESRAIVHLETGVVLKKEEKKKEEKKEKK